MKERNQGESSHSQLEALYWGYIESRGTDGEDINRCYRKLEQLLQEFPWKKQNDIQCAVNELGSVMERLAFLDGVRSGAKLMLELTE